MVENNTPRLSEKLMRGTVDSRHGIVYGCQTIEKSPCDVDSIFHYGSPTGDLIDWNGASGGVSFDESKAELASIGEAIERWVAGKIQIQTHDRKYLDKHNLKYRTINDWGLFTPGQINHPQFPQKKVFVDGVYGFTDAYDFYDNSLTYIPQPLVLLRDDYDTHVPTSSGLASSYSKKRALLLAIQEIIERDGLMTVWMNGLTPPNIAVPDVYRQSVEKLGGEIHMLDLTPKYSPFPVIATIGSIPWRGRPRYSLGVACRNTLEQAMEKSYLEWNQGVLFCRYYVLSTNENELKSEQPIVSFEQHAAYYTVNPDEWSDLPMFRASEIVEPSQRGVGDVDDEVALAAIRESAHRNNIDIYYRDITSFEAQQLGVHVVRATSPDMAMIFADQRLPFLNKVNERVIEKFPWAKDLSGFPNLKPHPLG